MENTTYIVDSLNKEGGKKIKYILEPNLGLHNARHAGAKAALGEILAYTDDDAICDKSWLSALLEEYDSDKIACVGGKILPKWQFTPPGWMKHFDPWTLCLVDYGEQRKESKWPENIFGCNFSVRKNLLYKLGGFDPECVGNNWIGDGEAGLLRRVHAAGLKIIYTPNAIVWHVITKERASLNGMKKRLSNFAVAHACVDFKIRRYNKLKLLLRSVYFFINSYKHLFLGLWNRLLKNDLFYFRQALVSYNKSRSIFELKLLIDKDLMEFVNREDWINEK